MHNHTALHFAFDHSIKQLALKRAAVLEFVTQVTIEGFFMYEYKAYAKILPLDKHYVEKNIPHISNVEIENSEPTSRN